MAANLSVQLLGEFEIVEKVVKMRDGPFVNLTNFQLQEQIEKSYSQTSSFPLASASKSKRSAGKLGIGKTWCAVCCKCCNEDDSRNFKDSPETLTKFIEKVASTNGSNDVAVSKLPFRSIPFCRNCHSAIKYLVSTLHHIRALETQVRDMTLKMKNVVQLSMTISHNENAVVNFKKESTLFRETILNDSIPDLQRQHSEKNYHPEDLPENEELNDFDDNDNIPILSPAVSTQEETHISEDNGQKVIHSGNKDDLIKVEVEDKVCDELLSQPAPDSDSYSSNASASKLTLDFDDTSSDKEKSKSTSNSSKKSKKVYKKKKTGGVKIDGNAKGVQNPRSFNNIPPERLSQSPGAIRWRQLRAEHPEKSQRELKAYLKKQTEERRKLGIGVPRPKGLSHEQSFINRPPEKLSQTAKAKRYRALRAQYPDKSEKEIYEIRRKMAAQRERKVKPKQIYPKATFDTTEDGRIFYKNIEIKKLESGLYACGKCEAGKTGAVRIHSIASHINRNHVPRTLKCSKCGKSFYHNHIYHYEAHIRFCQEKEKLVCHMCGVTFNHDPARLTHIRIVHKGIKPFTCEHCGKSFGTNKDLTIHVRRHTGERPFVCHVCGDTFIDKQSMKKHIRSRHPDAIESEQLGDPTVSCSKSIGSDPGAEESGSKEEELKNVLGTSIAEGSGENI